MRRLTPPEKLGRADDPRLADVVQFDPDNIQPGIPVLIGFPCDEGVRRNGGRVGAAEAPTEIRRWLYRLTPYDGVHGVELARNGLVDLGDVPITSDLEVDQQHLGLVVCEVLNLGGIPIVLGGGHETAFGVYLGHALAESEVFIVNVDAHLDVRPTVSGQGHSGSPFRQAIEFSPSLPGSQYLCVGAQSSMVSRFHVEWLIERGGAILWSEEVRGRFLDSVKSRVGNQDRVHLSLDADVVSAADVPGVSAVNPLGLSGVEVSVGVGRLAELKQFISFELVEINPRLDVEGRSARWAAQTIWQFLAGLARR